MTTALQVGAHLGLIDIQDPELATALPSNKKAGTGRASAPAPALTKQPASPAVKKVAAAAAAAKVTAAKKAKVAADSKASAGKTAAAAKTKAGTDH